MGLCDDLEGWDRENGREAQEGGDMGTCVCIWLIHFVVQQELTQYCEAIILQKRSIKKIICESTFGISDKSYHNAAKVPHLALHT